MTGPLRAGPIPVVDAELVSPGTGPRPPADVDAADAAVRHERIAAAWLAAQHSRQTEEAYRHDIMEFFAWCARWDIDPLRARRVHGDAYRRHLGELRPTRKPATIARKLAALSSYYAYVLVEFDDLIPGNPLSSVRRPRKGAGKTRTRHLDEDQVRALLTAADLAGPFPAALIRMLFETAVRVSELCTASTRDLHVVDGTLTLTITKKGGRETVVAVPTPAGAALHRHLRGRTGWLFRADDPRAAGDAYADDLGGRQPRRSTAGPITRRQVDYQVRRIATLAGLERRVSSHDLRHTMATLMVRGGADIRAVGAVLGHASLDTTQLYVDAAQNMAHSPVHAVATRLEQPPADRTNHRNTVG